LIVAGDNSHVTRNSVWNGEKRYWLWCKCKLGPTALR